MVHAARTQARWGAAVMAIAPAVMLAGFLYHPHIGNPTDADFLTNLGAAVETHPVRWAVAHLVIAVGSGLIILAFLALRAWLRAAHEEQWSAPAVPFVVMGGVFYALLPAMEFVPLAAATSGADAAAAQGALLTWFVPVLFAGAIIFLIGATCFAIAVSRVAMGGRGLARVAAAGIILMAAARLVPLNFVQLHTQGLMGLVALWPLAYVLWTRPEPSSPTGPRESARSMHSPGHAGAAR